MTSIDREIKVFLAGINRVNGTNISTIDEFRTLSMESLITYTFNTLKRSFVSFDNYFIPVHVFSYLWSSKKMTNANYNPEYNNLYHAIEKIVENSYILLNPMNANMNRIRNSHHILGVVIVLEELQHIYKQNKSIGIHLFTTVLNQTQNMRNHLWYVGLGGKDRSGKPFYIFDELLQEGYIPLPPFDHFHPIVSIDSGESWDDIVNLHSPPFSAENIIGHPEHEMHYNYIVKLNKLYDLQLKDGFEHAKFRGGRHVRHTRQRKTRQRRSRKHVKR